MCVTTSSTVWLALRGTSYEANAPRSVPRQTFTFSDSVIGRFWWPWIRQSRAGAGRRRREAVLSRPLIAIIGAAQT